MRPLISTSLFFARRAVLALALGAAAFAATAPAQAAPVAEQYVTDNVQKGLALLNNRSLSMAQRREQFSGFILSLTDMHRIAMFTLGQYRRTASPADQEAFAAAFQNYAVAVYQSYFSKYAGQMLKVTGSEEHGPGDFVVHTVMTDPNDHSGQQPLGIDFRVNTAGGKPIVLDFSVAGIYLAIEERDQFSAFLGQHNGDIHALIADLNNKAQSYK